MDCVSVALIALRLIGITLETLPAIVVNDDLKKGGYTELGGFPIVTVKDPNKCDVFIHEFIHRKQSEVFGFTTNKGELWKWEMDAARLTGQAVMEYQSFTGKRIDESGSQ